MAVGNRRSQAFSPSAIAAWKSQMFIEKPRRSCWPLVLSLIQRWSMQQVAALAGLRVGACSVNAFARQKVRHLIAP